MLITIDIKCDELDELQKQSQDKKIKDAYTTLIELAVGRRDYDRAFELLEEKKNLILG